MNELVKQNLLEVPAETYFNQVPAVIELKKKIEQAVYEAAEITVLTSSGLEKAAHFITNFKEIDKRLEKIRKEEKDIFFQKGKEIDAYFKSLQLLFQEQNDRLSKEIMDWKKKQDAIAKEKADAERKAAEDKAIEEALKKEKELQTQAIINGQNPADVKVEISIVPETITETVKLSSKNSSGLSTTRLKRFEVIDFNLIPKEYLMIDETKINLERKKHDFEAVSTIPGIKFTFTENLR